MNAIKRMEQAIAVQPLSEKVTIPKLDAESWVELARAAKGFIESIINVDSVGTSPIGDEIYYFEGGDILITALCDLQKED